MKCSELFFFVECDTINADKSERGRYVIMEFEKDIERRLICEVEKLNGRCVKWGVNGEPDRVILIPPSLCVFVELKRKEGKLSELQKVKISKLRNLGFKVYVPYSKNDVDMIIKDCRIMQEMAKERTRKWQE